jgi:Putative DNA-binding domain
MSYREELAESLLFEEEGPTLDFKRDQYRFEGAGDKEKAELLKDILAFANAWRRTDAYIYVGAEEVRGGRSKIVGIACHIDDAKLQQFVNAKTNRPIDFSYCPLEVEGRQIALIHIPVQQRPTYLKKDYGDLRKEAVYIRRGSSTAVATPDEIAQMGVASVGGSERVPLLTAYFVAGAHREVVDKSITLNVLNVEIPEESEFPRYGDTGYGLSGLRFAGPGTNSKFYFQYAKWLQTTRRFKGLYLSVKNTGSVARDVKLVVTIKKITEDIEVCEKDDLPHKPAPTIYDFGRLTPHSVFNKPDVICTATEDGWRIEAHLGKIQAMDTVITRDLLCIGARKTIEIPITAEIFSDELTNPVQEQLTVRVDVTDKRYSVGDFLRSRKTSEEN